MNRNSGNTKNTEITFDKVKAQNDGFFHFEDNGVRLYDAEENEVAAIEFNSQEEAKGFYLEMVRRINEDPEIIGDYVTYVPKFQPQRLKIGKKRKGQVPEF